MSKALWENKIYRGKPVKKPILNDGQKERRLAFCYQYEGRNWQELIFTDKSYFETGNLHSRCARGVLRHAGEAYKPHNINRKFAQGAPVIIWGVFLYGKSGMYL